MCGRFALYSPYTKLSKALRLPLEPEELTPRYNVAPGAWITAVRHPSDDAPLVMDEVWWGYRPHWAKEKAPEPINATVEKVATSNYFRGAFAHYRCLVPADGWYEPALFTRALIERSEGTGCWHCLSGFASSARIAVE